MKFEYCAITFGGDSDNDVTISTPIDLIVLHGKAKRTRPNQQSQLLSLAADHRRTLNKTLGVIEASVHDSCM